MAIAHKQRFATERVAHSECTLGLPRMVASVPPVGPTRTLCRTYLVSCASGGSRGS